MEWDRIEGNWEQFKGSVKREWNKLSDEQLVAIAGKREALSGSIRETYGITKETTERQVSFWQSVQRPTHLMDIQEPPVIPTLMDLQEPTDPQKSKDLKNLQ